MAKTFEYHEIQYPGDITPGSIVRLRSGGPFMTVERVQRTDGHGHTNVDCIWFDDSSAKKREFQLSGLDQVIAVDVPDEPTSVQELPAEEAVLEAAPPVRARSSRPGH